jgi:hypothetical protein
MSTLDAKCLDAGHFSDRTHANRSGETISDAQKGLVYSAFLKQITYKKVEIIIGKIKVNHTHSNKKTSHWIIKIKHTNN